MQVQSVQFNKIAAKNIVYSKEDETVTFEFEQNLKVGKYFQRLKF